MLLEHTPKHSTDSGHLSPCHHASKTSPGGSASLPFDTHSLPQVGMFLHGFFFKLSTLLTKVNCMKNVLKATN